MGKRFLSVTIPTLHNIIWYVCKIAIEKLEIYFRLPLSTISVGKPELQLHLTEESRQVPSIPH